MRPLYRCDYCDFTGTEDEVKSHEEGCIKNHTLKGCFTCAHCNTDGFSSITCMAGRDIPDGHMIQGCYLYAKGSVEVSGIMKVFSDLFNS